MFSRGKRRRYDDDDELASSSRWTTTTDRHRSTTTTANTYFHARSPPPPTRPTNTKCYTVTGYILFAAQERAALRSQLGDDIKFSEISRRLGQRWRDMDPSLKDQWRAKAAERSRQVQQQRLQQPADSVNKPSISEVRSRCYRYVVTGFVLFAASERRRIKAELGVRATFGQVSRELGELWNALDEEAKTAWNHKAALQTSKNRAAAAAEQQANSHDNNSNNASSSDIAFADDANRMNRFSAFVTDFDGANNASMADCADEVVHMEFPIDDDDDNDNDKSAVVMPSAAPHRSSPDVSAPPTPSTYVGVASIAQWLGARGELITRPRVLFENLRLLMQSSTSTPAARRRMLDEVPRYLLFVISLSHSQSEEIVRGAVVGAAEFDDPIAARFVRLLIRAADDAKVPAERRDALRRASTAIPPIRWNIESWIAKRPIEYLMRFVDSASDDNASMTEARHQWWNCQTVRLPSSVGTSVGAVLLHYCQLTRLADEGFGNDDPLAHICVAVKTADGLYRQVPPKIAGDSPFASVSGFDLLDIAGYDSLGSADHYPTALQIVVANRGAHQLGPMAVYRPLGAQEDDSGGATAVVRITGRWEQVSGDA